MTLDEDVAAIHRRFGAPARTAPRPPQAPGLTTGLYSARPRGEKPVVAADAMTLISDATRGARGKFTLMCFLAKLGVIRLVTAAHIDGKVYAGLPNACRSPAELEAAIAYYETEYRPVIRFIDPGELAASDERVIKVRAADVEDVALAQLGVTLAPSLIFTWDKHLIKAGLGGRQYADQLVLLKALVALDEKMWGMAEGAATGGRLAVMSAQGLIGLLRRSELATGLILGALAAAAYCNRDRLPGLPAAIRTKMGPTVSGVVTHIGSMFDEWQGAQADVETHLVAPVAARAIEAEIAIVLAQRDGPIPAPQIHAALSFDRRAAMSTRDILAILWAQPAFEFHHGRGWMLGHHIRP